MPYGNSLKERVQRALARKAAKQEQEQVMLGRQASMNQAQWDKVLAEPHQQQLGGSGSGRRASASAPEVDNTMDYSRFSDQDDTASTRFIF